jgi:Kdo2-lipid IVA lauroyltransferase/acyltransferase
VLFLFRLLSFLPLSWLHVLGGLLGRLVYRLSPTYRRHLRENLAQALGHADEALARAAAAEAGKLVLELPKIWLRPQAEVAARMRAVEGWEHVEAARAAGRGIVFLTPHLGCFEITSQYVATRFPLAVMYRPPKQDGLDRLIRVGRVRPGHDLVTADLRGVRTLIKVLRGGGAVGMLPDQAPKTGEGSWLDFFGRPAYTMTLAARLTETQAVTLLAWAERLPNGTGYRMRFRLPDPPLTGDTLARAAQINREMERLILACPAQYLWGYNRYKQPAGAEPPPVPKTASSV